MAGAKSFSPPTDVGSRVDLRQWVPFSSTFQPRAAPVHGRVELLVDAVVLMLVAMLFQAPAGWERAAALGGICLALFAASGRYRVAGGRSPSIEPLNVAAVSAVAMMAIVALSAAVGAATVPEAQTATLWLAATGGLIAARGAAVAFDAQLRAHAKGRRRVLILGAGDVGRLAARRLVARPKLGLEPVGFVDGHPLEGTEGDPPVLGPSWDLERVIAQHRIDTVLVGFSTAPHAMLLAAIRRCWELGVEVLVIPRLFEVEGTRTRIQHLGGLPLVRLHTAQDARNALWLKQVIDRTVAALLLVVAAPAMALITILVKLTSPGPVFHRAPRVGLHGRPFEMLKFRTMVGSPATRGETHVDWAEATIRAAAGNGGSNGVNGEALARLPPAATEDVRTPVGRFLRRTSLDELPQLWNVVCGEMAIVGPRPELVQYSELFNSAIRRYEERHRVRPGITGWAQVQGLRGKTSLADRVEWDNFYIENWSPWFDVKILLLTLSAVWRYGES